MTILKRLDTDVLSCRIESKEIEEVVEKMLRYEGDFIKQSGGVVVEELGKRGYNPVISLECFLWGALYAAKNYPEKEPKLNSPKYFSIHIREKIKEFIKENSHGEIDIFYSSAHPRETMSFKRV